MSSSHDTYKFPWIQWCAAFAASSAMLASNIDIVWLNEAQHISSGTELVARTTLVISGAFFAAVFADILGSRTTLPVTSVIFAIPRMFHTYLTGGGSIRMITDLIYFGSGVTCTIVPLYISEIADSNYRGHMIALQLSIYFLGRFVSQTLVDSFLVLDNYSHKVLYVHRNLLAISLILHAIFLFVDLDTPQYLKEKKYKSLAFLQEIGLIRSKRQGWSERMKEISLIENWRRLAIIFSLTIIRRASGQEWISLYTFDTMCRYYPVTGLYAAIFIVCLCIMLIIDIFQQKQYLLSVIFLSYVAMIFGMTSLIEHHWVVLGITFIQYFGHLILIGVTLAYVGEFFPINIRAIAIAAVMSWEVVTSHLFFLIQHSNNTTQFRMLNYTSAQTYCSSGAFLAAFLFLWIFLPKTRQILCSEIAMKTSADEKCTRKEKSFLSEKGNLRTTVNCYTVHSKI